ncbi:MAG: S-layer homology domain-containing protein [Bifidobacteriaceae bacterium]|jgi:hypothetical protein|nr:S-layer homology domain-containing protein [Bifidobacteriaceae bacterium]
MNNLKTDIVNRYKNFICSKSLFKKMIFCLIVVFGFQAACINFQTPLAKANTNDIPPAPRDVVIAQNGDSLGVSWAAPFPEPSGDWTYKVELVDGIDRVVQTVQDISKLVLTQTFQNMFTSNYRAKVYVQISGGQISPPAESDKSRPVQIALGAAATNINFTDISSLEAESQAKIKWAAAFGITTGYTPTTYNPKKAVNRRQMASFFKRLAGSPASSGQPIEFKDVTDKEQNKADIDWLSAAGITTGYVCTAKGKPDKACTKAGDAVYMPNVVVNRGQMAQFIYKYVGQPYISPDEVNSYMEEFSDSQKLRDNGQAEAVAWLLKYNITQGYPDSTYRPSTRVSREQMAVFLARLANILNITPYLAREAIETNGNLVLPTNFLNIPNLNRKDITKISFIETLPVCNNPVDVSSSKNGSILGCVQNGTEIVIGEPLGVRGNPYSADGLFSNLSTSALQSLDFSTISNLENVFSAYAAFAVDQGFANSAIPNNFAFLKDFGAKSENMAYMFANRVFAQNEIFGEDFARNANNMNGMFSGATLNGDIDWSETNFSISKASKSDMFTNTVWNNYFIFAQNSASKTFLITNSNISDPSRIVIEGEESVLKFEKSNPVTFLGMPGPTRAQITKISFQKAKPTCSNPTDLSYDGDKSILGCVKNNTEIIVGSDGGVEANPDSSYLFSNLTFSGSVDIDLSNLKTSSIVNMSGMFESTSLPRGLTFPAGFGSAVLDGSGMFEGALFNGSIDWSGTDLTNSRASKTHMFTNVIWNNWFMIVQNENSRNFLINGSDISDSSNVRVKGTETMLRTEDNYPTKFLGITNPTRNAITKISFQNATPVCSNPIDVSQYREWGVIACVKNSTEIVIGGDGGVLANPDSSYLFSNLTAPGGVEIDLSNLKTTAITNMNSMFFQSSMKSGFTFPQGFGSQAANISYMFYYASLPNGFTLPQGFGSQASDMSCMFYHASLPDIFSLPEGFGQVATSMHWMFMYVTLPAGFSLPQGFGNQATDMRYMFSYAVLNDYIDWSSIDLTDSTALADQMFTNTVWNNHFIFVKNAGTRTFLITNTGISDDTRIKIKT